MLHTSGTGAGSVEFRSMWSNASISAELRSKSSGGGGCVATVRAVVGLEDGGSGMIGACCKAGTWVVDCTGTEVEDKVSDIGGIVAIPEIDLSTSCNPGITCSSASFIWGNI